MQLKIMPMQMEREDKIEQIQAKFIKQPGTARQAASHRQQGATNQLNAASVLNCHFNK